MRLWCMEWRRVDQSTQIALWQKSEPKMLCYGKCYKLNF